MTLMDIPYVRSIWRIIFKNRAFSAINMLGLSLGLFSVILVALWISYESGFDRFHHNYRQIYRVVNNWGNDRDVSCPGALAAYAKENFPEVIEAATFSVGPGMKLSGENGRGWFTGGIADSSFFNLFSFAFVEGSSDEPFPGPNSVVITRATAEALFAGQNPLDQMIKMEYEDWELELVVSGIMEDIPVNSSLQFDFLFSSALGPPGYFVWTNNWPEIFLLLEEGSSVSALDAKIRDLAKQHDKEAINTFELKSFGKEHLYLLNGNGLIVYLRVFGIIAFVILCMACFNYINLSTAMMTDRQKEIGIKKAFGFSRPRLRKQYLTEAGILTVLAFLLALWATRLFLPLLNQLLRKHIEYHFHPVLILLLLGVVVITTLLSGLYPAFHLASINPLSALRKTNIVGNTKHISLRQVLVICQFTCSIMLVIMLLGLFRQLNYMQNKDMGFNKEGILVVPLQGKAKHEVPVIKEILASDPHILLATATAFHPVMQEGETSFVDWDSSPDHEKVSCKYNYVDYEYLETMGIQLESGRFFDSDYSDHASSRFVVNEELVKKMDLDEPLGQEMVLFNNHRGRIIGVMKNFHNEPLYNNIRGYALMLGNSYNYLSLHISTQDISRTVNFIEETLKNIEPEYLFSFRFLDDEISSKYYREVLIGKLTGGLALLSIIISILGIIGLVLFTLKKQSKEIAVRKVNGASTANILLLLNTGFSRWVLVSFIIACPLAYFALRRWYENFAYRTAISGWLFLLAGLCVFSIISLIVNLQSIKYARQNPASTLQYE